jgi:hypothetical protein
MNQELRIKRFLTAFIPSVKVLVLAEGEVLRMTIGTLRMTPKKNLMILSGRARKMGRLEG